MKKIWCITLGSKLASSGMALAGYSSCKALQRHANVEVVITQVPDLKRKKVLLERYNPDVIFMGGLAWYDFYRRFYVGLEEYNGLLFPQLITGNMDWSTVLPDKDVYSKTIHLLNNRCTKVIGRSLITINHGIYNGLDYNNMVYVPECFDEEIFKPLSTSEYRNKYSLPQDKIIIGLFGGASKGIIEVVEALKKLWDLNVDIKNNVVCLWLPDARYESSKNLFKQEVVDFKDNFKRITLERYSPSQISELLNCCDVLAAPSRHETFGRVHVEAQMCGVPIITSRSYVTSCHENVVHNRTGLLVGAKTMQENACKANIEELVSALNSLIVDKDLRDTMSKNAHAWATEKYSYKTVSGQLMKLFNDCDPQ